MTARRALMLMFDIDNSVEKQARVDSRRSPPARALLACKSKIFPFLRQKPKLFFVCVFLDIDAVSYERSHIDKSKDRLLN